MISFLSLAISPAIRLGFLQGAEGWIAEEKNEGEGGRERQNPGMVPDTHLACSLYAPCPGLEKIATRINRKKPNDQELVRGIRRDQLTSAHAMQSVVPCPASASEKESEVSYTLE